MSKEGCAPSFRTNKAMLDRGSEESPVFPLLVWGLNGNQLTAIEDDVTRSRTELAYDQTKASEHCQSSHTYGRVGF